MLREYEESLLITSWKVSDLQTFLVISHHHKRLLRRSTERKSDLLFRAPLTFCDILQGLSLSVPNEEFVTDENLYLQD